MIHDLGLVYSTFRRRKLHPKAKKSSLSRRMPAVKGKKKLHIAMRIRNTTADHWETEVNFCQPCDRFPFGCCAANTTCMADSAADTRAKVNTNGATKLFI